MFLTSVVCRVALGYNVVGCMFSNVFTLLDRPTTCTVNSVFIDKHCCSSVLMLHPTVWNQGSHASWKVLDFFSWKFQDLESPGKALWSWKVLEKYPENYAFFIGPNGKQAEIVNVPVCVDFYLLCRLWLSTFCFVLQFLQWTILRMLWVKGVFSLYLTIHGLRKGPGKFLAVVLESAGKVLDFFSSEIVWTLWNSLHSFVRTADSFAIVLGLKT